MMAFSSLAYYAFELEMWRRFEARIKAREFDLVHRITPLSPTSQSLIAKRLAKCGVPFMLGPSMAGCRGPNISSTGSMRSGNGCPMCGRSTN